METRPGVSSIASALLLAGLVFVLQLVNAFLLPPESLGGQWAWCGYAEYGEENRTSDCGNLGLTPLLGLLAAPGLAAFGGWRYGARALTVPWIAAFVALLFFAPNVANRL